MELEMLRSAAGKDNGGCQWDSTRRSNRHRCGYFEAMVGFTQPFFITPCDGRKLR
jgi:hypothetical protein